MTKLSKVLRVCAMAALPIAAACSTPVVNGPEQEFNVNQRYPISVQPRMMSLNLIYNGQAELDQNQSGQLARFAEDYRAHGSGSISVSAPTAAAADIAVASLLEIGVARTQIMVGGATGPNPLNDIRVTYIRYVAEAPACGNWSGNLSQTANNVLPPNFGCATQHNFAAMVADPRDLVAPDTTGQADAQRRLTVLQKYRAGEETPGARSELQKSGAISEIAQ
jgi:pilus assembly protein CpaD